MAKDLSFCVFFYSEQMETTKVMVSPEKYSSLYFKLALYFFQISNLYIF
jgi:hypothetical protein